MKVPASLDRQTFLSNLRESGLLANGQVGPVLRTLPADARARTVAAALVDAGLLTRFQANHLLGGRVRGFLLGQYRILEQIGRGAMGRVFKAEHRTMGRTVALKVLAPSVVQSDRALQLFQREIRAVSHLVHPNIVTAYDANEETGHHYLVLEYVDGPNLDQLVRREGPLPVGVAADYIRQVANGLQSAHETGMVHRDIKPANLLVHRRGPTDSSPGLIKISDFGLARLQSPGSDSSTRLATIFVKDNTVMGTPDYLSPEQARSLHKADIRSDLYSLGCTFYFLLTGRVPFPGGTPVEKLIRHGTETPTAIQELRPEVPPAVVAIVNKLLAKRPEDRYQTPAALAAALEPFAVSGPTPWGPPPMAIPVSSQAQVLAAQEDCVVGELDVLDGSDSNADGPSPRSTVVQDRSPTPPPPSEPLYRSRAVPVVQRHAARQRLQLALLAATAIVAMLLALIVFLLLQAR
jgi:serine/threonine-protein kinase